MELTKVYDKTCDVCQMLAGIDEQVAEDNDLFFRQMTIEQVARNPSHIRDYVVEHHVVDGDIDVPIYLISTQQGRILSSGLIKSVEELKNLINATKQVTEGLSTL